MHRENVELACPHERQDSLGFSLIACSCSSSSVPPSRPRFHTPVYHSHFRRRIEDALQHDEASLVVARCCRRRLRVSWIA